MNRVLKVVIRVFLGIMVVLLIALGVLRNESAFSYPPGWISSTSEIGISI